MERSPYPSTAALIALTLVAIALVGCGPGDPSDPGNRNNGNVNANVNVNDNGNSNAVCGDGVVQSGEECDDGNASNNDDCPDGTGGTCLAASCSDGFVHDEGAGDESDVDCGGTCGSNCANGDACNSGSDCTSGSCPAGVCVVITCGDGIVQTGEECDGDGAGTGGETAGCDIDCTFSLCGDNYVNTIAGETCDDGNASNNDDCPDGTSGTCLAASCSDGFVHDQGTGDESDVDCGGSCGSNCANGDACNGGADCTSGSCPAGVCVSITCGDGIVQSGEDCDGDGAGTGGETAGCNIDCTFSLCGDNYVNSVAGETCDDGNASNNDDCPDGTGGTCLAASCSDGFVHDQGTGDESDVDCGGSCGSNCATGDACNSGADCTNGSCPAGVCVAVACGDGFVQSGEDCDGDGAGTGGETASCDSDCTFSLCGDSHVNNNAGETCDDGNANNNDDCPDGTGGTCQSATCSDGFLHNQGTGTETDIDCGGTTCLACPGVLLLSEIVVAPTGGEFVEIHNPSASTVSLSNVYLADFNAYYTIASGSPTAPGAADFRVYFPPGTMLAAGARIVISAETASAFNTAYGFYPDFDFDAADANAPAMLGEIGGSAGLTNGDEMVMLFTWDGISTVVADIDYILWGNASDAVSKTGIIGYLPDTASASQDFAAAPGSTGSLVRCDLSEGTEVTTGGNGYLGHDETSENMSVTWEVSGSPSPGTANVCSYKHTITIDGTNDFSTADDLFSSTSTGYTGYVTWDDTYLYIGMEGADVAANDVNKLLLIYLDAGAATTNTTGRLYGTTNPQEPVLPFGASHHFYWRTNNADTAAFTTDGATWNLDGSWDWSGDVFQTGNYVELRLPLADIGVSPPETVNVHLSMVNAEDTSEWTYAGVPSDSFTDGSDPDYTRFFAFDIGGPTSPNAHTSQ